MNSGLTNKQTNKHTSGNGQVEALNRICERKNSKEKLEKDPRTTARLLHSSVCVYVYVAVYLHLSPESIFLLTLLCYDHYLKKAVFLNEAVFFL